MANPCGTSFGHDGCGFTFTDSNKGKEFRKEVPNSKDKKEEKKEEKK